MCLRSGRAGATFAARSETCVSEQHEHQKEGRCAQSAADVVGGQQAFEEAAREGDDQKGAQGLIYSVEIEAHHKVRHKKHERACHQPREDEPPLEHGTKQLLGTTQPARPLARLLVA